MADVQLTSISPTFQVADMARSLDWYRRVLGFEVAWQAGDPPALASVCRDVVVITLQTAATPVLAHAYLSVQGVDDFFASAAAAGARIPVPLENRWYGMRDGRIADPDGNELSVGEETSPENG